MNHYRGYKTINPPLIPVDYSGIEITKVSLLLKLLDYFDQLLFRNARAARLKTPVWLFRFRNNYRFSRHIISTKYYFELRAQRAGKFSIHYFGTEITKTKLYNKALYYFELMLFRTAHTIGYFGTEIIWISMLVKNLGYFDQILFRTARPARLEKIEWLFRYRYRFSCHIFSNCAYHLFSVSKYYGWLFRYRNSFSYIF